MFDVAPWGLMMSPIQYGVEMGCSVKLYIYIYIYMVSFCWFFFLFWWLEREETNVYINGEQGMNQRLEKRWLIKRTKLVHLCLLSIFFFLPWSWRLNGENKEEKILILICVFLPHPINNYLQHSSDWWLCYNCL